MCIFGGGGDPPTTTQKNSPDPLTEQIRRYLVPYATQIANQSFPSYPGAQRLEPFSPTQKNAFGDVIDFAQPQSNSGYNYAQQQARSYGNASAGRIGQDPRFNQMPQNINTKRIVDEGGRLGKISDYMNPYVQGVIDPQIREISKAADRARIQSGEAATFGGAFGDARHGVADSLTRGEEFEAKSDAAGRGWSDAYNQAMGLRGADVQRFMAADQFNRQQREAALQRQLQTQQTNKDLREQMFARQAASGQNAMQYGLQRNQDYLQRLNAQMNVGNMQQQQGQKLRDYDYQNFQNGVQWPFTQYNALLSMLTGQPTGATQQTSQQTGGNQGWMNILGSIFGAMI